jgi:hypothetical protein
VKKFTKAELNAMVREAVKQQQDRQKKAVARIKSTGSVSAARKSFDDAKKAHASIWPSSSSVAAAGKPAYSILPSAAKSASVSAPVAPAKPVEKQMSALDIAKAAAAEKMKAAKEAAARKITQAAAGAKELKKEALLMLEDLDDTGSVDPRENASANKARKAAFRAAQEARRLAAAPKTGGRRRVYW